MTTAQLLTREEQDAIRDAAARELREDGDIFQVSETVRLRLAIEPDEATSLDGDWFGQVEHVRVDPWTGQHHRPDGFDGRAQVLYRGRHEVIWWQPPADVIDKPEVLASIRRTLLEILQFGYIMLTVVLEVRVTNVGAYKVDAGWIVADSDTIGGVEPFPTGDVIADIVGDLLHDMEIPYSHA